jgi:hypothetical protein
MDGHIDFCLVAILMSFIVLLFVWNVKDLPSVRVRTVQFQLLALGGFVLSRSSNFRSFRYLLLLSTLLQQKRLTMTYPVSSLSLSSIILNGKRSVTSRVHSKTVE